MKLAIQQKELFLKKLKLQKKQVSKYAIREMKTLFNANEQMNEPVKNVYQLSDVKNELLKVKRHLDKHPRIKEKYETLEKRFLTFVYGLETTKMFVLDIFPAVESIEKETKLTVSEMFAKDVIANQKETCHQLLKDALLLQASLGLELDKKYSDIIDELFSELYQKLDNDEYVDQYVKCKK